MFLLLTTLPVRNTGSGCTVSSATQRVVCELSQSCAHPRVRRVQHWLSGVVGVHSLLWCEEGWTPTTEVRGDTFFSPKPAGSAGDGENMCHSVRRKECGVSLLSHAVSWLCHGEKQSHYTLPTAGGGEAGVLRHQL